MDYDEFKALAETVADVLGGDLLPFEPGELPTIAFVVEGVELAAELSPV